VRVCRVRPDVPAIRRAFDYLVPASLADAVHQGAQVRVELHGRRVHGWVVDADVAAPETSLERLRPLLAVSSAGPPPEVLALCEWAAWRWAGPVVTFLRGSRENVDVGLVVDPSRCTRVGAPRGDAWCSPRQPRILGRAAAGERGSPSWSILSRRAARRADLASAGRVV
jgi:primosomal protein N' (replication factor Y)